MELSWNLVKVNLMVDGELFLLKYALKLEIDGLGENPRITGDEGE